MASTSDRAADRRARAEAERAALKRRESRRRLLAIAAVVLAVVLIVGGAVLAVLLGQDEEEVNAAPAGSSDYGVTIGPDDAPHTVVIYEDFLCPFCGALEEQTAGELDQLAADGKVFVEYRPFNLLTGADYSMRATNAFAVVLDAAGPEVAKEFHDLLYENQPAESNPDSVSDDDLVTLAVKAGAEEDQVRDGIENLEQEEWVDQATQEAQDAGVTGTPTILLDGERFEQGSTIEDLSSNLLAAVE